MQKTLLKIGKKEEENLESKLADPFWLAVTQLAKVATYGYFGIYLPLVLGDLICRLTH
jgi:hypothetical protein